MKHFSLCRGSFLLLLLVLILCQSTAQAQAPSWQAAINTGDKVVNAVATDASGNVFIAGNFTGTTSFGNTTMTAILSSTDGFVAKWSPASNSFVWAKQVDGYGRAAEDCTAIAVSGNNVYIVGSFQSTTITFGNSVLTNQGNTSGSAPVFTDMYVAKLVDAGTSASFVWGQSPTGGPVWEYGTAVAVSGSNVYVAGVFASQTLNFGGTSLSNGSARFIPPTPYGFYSDIFVAKLTDAGASASFVWAKGGGGSADDNVKQLVVAGSDLFITGDFSGPTATFGAYNLTNTSAGNRLFMTKLTDAGSTGAYAWVQATPLSMRVKAAATNGSDIYLAGYLDGTTSFGATTLTPIGATDMYVAKWSGVGNNYVWAVRAGGANTEGADALAVNGNAVYVAGRFNSPTAAFGSSVLTSSTSSSTADNVFVAKLTDGGTGASFDWAQQTGGTGANSPNALAVSGTSVHVVGRATPPVAFGNYVIASPVGTSVSFLASLAANPLGTSGSQLWAGVDLYPNPAHGTATVQLPPIAGAATATLTLLDALGRAVRTQTVALPTAGLRHELNLTGLPAGLYALRMAAGSSTATRRLAVE